MKKTFEKLLVNEGFQGDLHCVTKTRPIEVIQEFQALGHNIFGENRVDALLQRQEELADDVHNTVFYWPPSTKKSSQTCSPMSSYSFCR